MTIDFLNKSAVAARLLLPTAEDQENLNLLLSLPGRPHPDPGLFFPGGPTPDPGAFYLPQRRKPQPATPARNHRVELQLIAFRRARSGGRYRRNQDRPRDRLHRPRLFLPRTASNLS